MAPLKNIKHQHLKVQSNIFLQNVNYLLYGYPGAPQTPKGWVTLAQLHCLLD